MHGKNLQFLAYISVKAERNVLSMTRLGMLHICCHKALLFLQFKESC